MRVAPVKAVVKCSPKTSLVSPSGDSFGPEGHCPNQNVSQPTPVSPIYPSSQFQQLVFQILRAMCVPVDFTGTDNRFYSSHSEGHVFSPHPAPHRKLKMLHGLHIKYINYVHVLLLIFSWREGM